MVVNSNVARDLVKHFLAGINAGEKPLIVLLGPTASGKTALSIPLAKSIGAEIVSADSRQVYRHMDIGTDKISLEARDGVEHHLIDVAEPSERFTVADYKKMAEGKIDEVLRRGKIPMVVGGTGFYIEALVYNFDIPKENLSLRAELARELQERGAEHLHKRLTELDPESAAKIHPHNTRYVLRALEIVCTTKKKKGMGRNRPLYRNLLLGLQPEREVLFKRIDERVEAQIERGLIDETKKLLSMGFSKELPSMSSLGYKEMIAHLEGRMTLTEATELLKKNTRNYAKRQRTWFKRDKNIHWI